MAMIKKTMRAVKAGMKGAFGAAFQAGKYKAGGKAVACFHCGAVSFSEREALLNTTGATLLNLDWLNTAGIALVCKNCGLIHWFARRPDRV